jgi:uncharacterized protein YxjI
MTLQDYSTFVLKQRITPLINRYEYFGRDGETEAPLAFVEQKRFKIREEVTAWASEDKTDIVYIMKAEKLLDMHGKFLVTDGEGRLVGYLRKVFGKSLLRSTWEVYSASDELLLSAQETNQTVAIVRRIGGFIPVIGDLLQLLPFNFQFLAGGQQAGFYNRIMGLRDNYDIKLEGEGLKIDRRLILALGIALDALQDR